MNGQSATVRQHGTRGIAASVWGVFTAAAPGVALLVVRPHMPHSAPVLDALFLYLAMCLTTLAWMVFGRNALPAAGRRAGVFFAVAVAVVAASVFWAMRPTLMMDGYMPPSASVSSMSLGLAVGAAVLASLRVFAFPRHAPPNWWVLLAGLPGVGLPWSGAALADALGVGLAQPWPAFVVAAGLGMLVLTLPLAAALALKGSASAQLWAVGAVWLAVSAVLSLVVFAALALLTLTSSNPLDPATRYGPLATFATALVSTATLRWSLRRRVS